MQLKWGTYAFPANGVQCHSTRNLLKTRANIPYGVRVNVSCWGYLTGAGQGPLIQAESALKTALERGFQDLYFYADDGVTTSPTISLSNASSISGVTIVSGPDFTSEYGAEYATQRRFEFTAQADYPLANTSQRLIDFRERLTLSGGLPLRVCRPAIDTAPQTQIVYLVTPYEAVQEGEAIGFLRQPMPVAPLFPGALVGGNTAPVTYDSPDRSGNTYNNWPVRWHYQFISPTPLVGQPTKWPLAL